MIYNYIIIIVFTIIFISIILFSFILSAPKPEVTAIPMTLPPKPALETPPLYSFISVPKTQVPVIPMSTSQETALETPPLYKKKTNISYKNLNTDVTILNTTNNNCYESCNRNVKCNGYSITSIPNNPDYNCTFYYDGLIEPRISLGTNTYYKISGNEPDNNVTISNLNLTNCSMLCQGMSCPLYVFNNINKECKLRL